MALTAYLSTGGFSLRCRCGHKLTQCTLPHLERIGKVRVREGKKVAGVDSNL